MIQLRRLSGRPTPKRWHANLGRSPIAARSDQRRAAVTLWLKDVAPSTELRKWFGHDPGKRKQFQGRHRKELRGKKDSIELLKRKSEEHTVTLVYGGRDEEHNEALVRKTILGGRT